MTSTLSSPKLVVRVGITGHRKLGDDPQGQQAISAALIRVFETLQSQVNVLHQIDQGQADLSLYDDKPPTLRLISGLAAGADQLAAAKALELGWQLEAVLPFTVEEYRKDFGTPAEPSRFGEAFGLPGGDDLAAFEALLDKAGPACLELCGPAEPVELRNRSYLAVGQSIVRGCEVLVAIWDGHEAAGKGGSAEVIEFALRSDKPVIWINSRDPERVCWLRVVEDYYNALQHAYAHPDFTKDKFRNWLGINLLPAVEGLDEGQRRQVSETLQRFRTDLRAEPGVGNARAAGLFKWVRNRLSKNSSQSHNSRRTPNSLEQYFLDFFESIDARADYLANCYRSTYTAIIGLGSLAIVLAILGVARFHPLIVSTEFIVLIAIGLLIWNEKKSFYHRRWVDGRTFAELLRIARWMILLGRELPVGINAGSTHESKSKSTILSENILLKHYFNAIVRAAPTPGLKFDHGYLKQVSQGISDDLLSEQINYHDGNAGRSHQISHRLESFAYWTLGSTILVVGAEIVLELCMASPGGHGSHHFPLPGVLAGVLPTIAAATAAFRHQSEFELLAIRSKLMANNLRAIKQKLERSSHDRPWATELLAEQLITTAELMVADVADWSLVFQVKAVEPA